jgi:hypothetical protein
MMNVERFLRHTRQYDVTLKPKYKAQMFMNYENSGKPDPSDEMIQKSFGEELEKLSSEEFNLFHEINGSKKDVVDIDFVNRQIQVTHPFR